MSDTISDIRAALDALNAAWRERRFDDLAARLDEHVVMRGPGLQELARIIHE